MKMKKPESALTRSGQRSKPDLLSKTKSSINHKNKCMKNYLSEEFFDLTKQLKKDENNLSSDSGVCVITFCYKRQFTGSKSECCIERCLRYSGNQSDRKSD